MNKIKIENLGIETTLEKFVEDWDLDINEINEELDKNSCYRDVYVEIEREDNIITIRILTDLWEVYDMVNEIYDDYYLFVVKDVFSGDYGELKYTQFSIENPASKTNNIFYVFKGGEYHEKSILNEEELSKFYNQRDEEKIEHTDYQEVWFVKEENFIRNGWEKTIKSFDLHDWDKYKF